MNKIKLKFAVILLISGGVFLVFVGAHSITAYTLNKWTISQAGGTANSANYRVYDAIGQTSVIGVSSSPSYQSRAGFLAGSEIPTSIGNKFHQNGPYDFELYPNYPNPFNPTTTIEFTLPKPAFVALKIYNLQGEEVMTLMAQHCAAGMHKFNWEARGVASGVYLLRLEAEEFGQARKLILMR